MDPKEKLPKEYYNLAKAFSKKIANSLPLRRDGVDYEIHLKLGGDPPFRRPYTIS